MRSDMHKKILGRERGFTLLEVVFAVGILAIGIMGYASLKVSNRYSYVFAKDLSLAVQLTGSQMEELLMYGYLDPRLATDAVTKTGAYTFTYDQYSTQYGVDLKIGDFKPDGVSWTVREGCPSQLTKMVSYTTNWTVGGPKTMTVPQVQVRDPWQWK